MASRTSTSGSSAVGVQQDLVRGCTYADLSGQAVDVAFIATSARLLTELPPVPARAVAPCPPAC